VIEMIELDKDGMRIDSDGMRMYDDKGNYIPKGKRDKKGRQIPEFDLKKVKDGLFLAFKGHPPAGEELELLWFGFNEKAAKDWAVVKGAYVYQLIYSPTGNPR